MKNVLVMMTIMILSAGHVLEKLGGILIPIGICVVLPVLVIWLALRNQQHEVDKKTEVMLKAIENGAELDPAFFQQATKRQPKNVKDKLMGYLTTACVTSAIGLIAGIVCSIVFTMAGAWTDAPEMAFFYVIPCAILLAVGLAFFIVYFVGRKTWAKELADLNAGQNG